MKRLHVLLVAVSLVAPSTAVANPGSQSITVEVGNLDLGSDEGQRNFDDAHSARGNRVVQKPSYGEPAAQHPTGTGVRPASESQRRSCCENPDRVSRFKVGQGRLTVPV